MPTNLEFLTLVDSNCYKLRYDIEEWLIEYCGTSWYWNEELWQDMSLFKAKYLRSIHEDINVIIEIYDARLATLFKLTWI